MPSPFPWSPEISECLGDKTNNMDNVDSNNEEYNPNKKRAILILFDDKIADMLSNKKNLIQ